MSSFIVSFALRTVQGEKFHLIRMICSSCLEKTLSVSAYSLWSYVMIETAVSLLTAFRHNCVMGVCHFTLLCVWFWLFWICLKLLQEWWYDKDNLLCSKIFYLIQIYLIQVRSLFIICIMLRHSVLFHLILHSHCFVSLEILL